jgi:hypothetical protein
VKAVAPTAAPSAAKKEKKEKEKKEAAPVEEFVNTTPPGEKKGEIEHHDRASPLLMKRRLR